MEYTPYIILGFGVLATLLFFVVRVKRGGVLGVLTKALASLFFVATAVAATIVTGDSTFGSLIVLGLVCGLIGDIVLDLKVVYPQDNDLWTYSGMGSFAIGHVMYLLAMGLSLPAIAKYGQNIYLITCIPLAIALLVAVVAVLGAPKMGLDYGKFRVPSFIYAFELTYMMCFAGATALVDDFYPRWAILFVGALLFLISDLILSQQYFSKDDSKMKDPILVVANHATYYAAQFLIAISVLC